MFSRMLLMLGASLLFSAVRAASVPGCEWCGASEAPSNVTSRAVLAGDDEPGQRLIMRGTVYAADGVTAAPGVLLYAYHTNAAGIYPKPAEARGNAIRHGYLRGWVISDDKGRFEFRTIRPGTYPNRSEPAHIHMTVKEPGRPEYWIDPVWFKGDPLITTPNLARLTGRGGPAIVTPERAPNGELIIRRDVILAAPGDIR